VVEPKPLPAVAVRRRASPKLAGWLSVIPGLGQLYNRQLRKALVFLAGVVALFFAAFNIPALTDWLLIWWQPRGGLMVGLSLLVQMLSLLLFLGLFLGAFTFWYAAMHDAMASAREINGEREPKGRWWFFRRVARAKSHT
jgi:arabinogalactan oligomer/maltooligosaccharide transport system permease protein